MKDNVCKSIPLRKKRNCTIRVAKTKALISCAFTAQLIFAFVFAYAKILFSHDAAHIMLTSYSHKVDWPLNTRNDMNVQ